MKTFLKNFWTTKRQKYLLTAKKKVRNYGSLQRNPGKAPAMIKDKKKEVRGCAFIG